MASHARTISRSTLTPSPRLTPRPLIRAIFLFRPHSYKDRARTVKHAADARSRAHPSSSSLPPTVYSLMSAVELTDSILMFVYAFWCEDQTTPGRVGVDMWRSLDGMKKVVRTLWEGVVKSSGGGSEEESAKALLGLWSVTTYLVQCRRLCMLELTVYSSRVTMQLPD